MAVWTDIMHSGAMNNASAQGENSDLELEEIQSEQDDLEIDDAPYEIRTLGADFSLEHYSRKIESQEIVIPEFQRNYVWPVKKASRLIESFLLGLPVPQVFLFQEVVNRDLLVVDGQQRLLTVHFFLRGFLQDGRTPFALKGVKSKWEGKLFAELEESDKRRLQNYILRATIFEQIDPDDNKSVYEIFERLNTGAMPLTQQEVRNCVTRGTINEFLASLNKTLAWRELLGDPEPDTRMKDIELILRFFALLEGWTTYKKPMKDFISSYMARHANVTVEEQTQLRQLFESVTQTIRDQVGGEAFHLTRGRVNVAILDSVMTATALTGPDNIHDLKAILETLKSKDTFREYISRSTTNDDSVKGRIKMCVSALAPSHAS